MQPLLRVSDRRDYYRKDYLKGLHWNFIKSQMLKRYPACQVCGSKHSLNVHHRIYKHLFDIKPSDMAVLCRRHHELIHQKDSTGEKPGINEVERRLQAILPVMRDNPRKAFMRLMKRFRSASVPLRTKYNKLVNRRLKPFRESGRDFYNLELSFSDLFSSSL